jgi:four helix bundle protein
MNDEVKTDRKQDLSVRTKDFALRIVRMYVKLPKSPLSEVLGKQVLRSGTSVGAHYREAKRARSKTEFISKLEVAIQELDETGYWLELICESKVVRGDLLVDLRDEVRELLAILVASVKTAKRNRSNS